LPEAASKPFHILSLSGGGYFGLYTISVLAGIEEASGKPLARSFELLAGTSVGGIIALGLAAEVPAAEIKTAFERNGTAIFSERPVPTSWWGAARDLARYVAKPKYQSDALRQTIAGLIGAETCIGDLKHPVIVPAVNLTKGRPQVFKTPHHPDFRTDLYLRVVDIALATSAAPTYFPVAEISDALYADGGLYANRLISLRSMRPSISFSGRNRPFVCSVSAPRPRSSPSLTRMGASSVPSDGGANSAWSMSSSPRSSTRSIT
jgi:uncharacterized protein